jgi:hypothetical protein
MKRTLVALLLALAAVAAGAQPDRPLPWAECVYRMGDFFNLTTPTTAVWSAEGRDRCGFHDMSVDDVRRELLFADGANSTHALLGDSTGLRAFIYTVNRVVRPGELQYSKLAVAPRKMQKLLWANGTRVPTAAAFRFWALMFISSAKESVLDAVTSAGRGTVIVTLGNWDMNWKIGAKPAQRVMPGFDGALTFESAQRYWCKYVTRLFAALNTVLQQLPAGRRPYVVVREQYQPNCAASRFAAKTRRFRQCKPLLRPVVVPFYRRVVARLAWAMAIPVIPVDHLFAREQCVMSDGVHLDFECMAHEHQLLWNTALLMKRRAVRQGLPAGEALPAAAAFGNETQFQAWWDAFRANGNRRSPAAEPSNPPIVSAGQPVVRAPSRSISVDGFAPATTSPTVSHVPRATSAWLGPFVVGGVVLGLLAVISRKVL